MHGPFRDDCAYMKKSEKAFAAITHGTGVPFVAGRTFRLRGDKERIPKRRAIVRWGAQQDSLHCTGWTRVIAAALLTEARLGDQVSPSKRENIRGAFQNLREIFHTRLDFYSHFSYNLGLVCSAEQTMIGDWTSLHRLC
jgi:hypothetical protein